MKVLLVQKVAGISGSENYLLNILPALNKKGVKAEFLCLYEKKDTDKIEGFLKQLSALDIVYHIITVPVLPGLFTFNKISAFLRKNGFDIVHTNLLHADLILAVTKMLFYPRMKLVSGKHGFDEMYLKNYGFSIKKGFNNKYVIVAKFAEKFIDKSFAISKGIQDVFTGLNIARRDKIRLIYYGFDFEFQSFATSNIRKSPKQILIIGRLVPYKGHEFVLKALPDIIAVHPDISLVIVGNGSYEETLKKITEDLKLEKYVHFEGHRKNVNEYLFNSDILAVPSIAEGFGIVFLEAFSQKKPVIAFDVPAGNEIIEDKKTGALVRPYETKELSKEINILFDNSEKMIKMGEEGYLKLKKIYTLDRMVDETINLYKECL